MLLNSQPSECPEALAAGIISIIRDRNTAKKMGETGRQTVETRFGVEKMVGETVDVYMELILDK